METPGFNHQGRVHQPAGDRRRRDPGAGRAEKQKAEGASTHDALLVAGPIRLRPILMTTAAMILGMLPVALALGEGGEGRAPMAVVVIGGLVTSTLLTLVVVPVVYSLIEGLRDRLHRKRPPVATIVGG